MENLLFFPYGCDILADGYGMIDVYKRQGHGEIGIVIPHSRPLFRQPDARNSRQTISVLFHRGFPFFYIFIDMAQITRCV